MATKRRGCLGCSFPLLIVIAVLFLGLLGIGVISGPLGKALLGDVGLPAWIATPRPEVSLPAETVFYLFGFPIANTVISAWVTMAVLVGVSYAITRRMKLVPGRAQAVFEFLLGWLYDFCQRVAGDRNGRRFFPVVATIFLFVAFNAWLSLIPGYGSITFTDEHGEHIHLLRGVNTDINFPLALALISFCVVVVNGVRALGLGYVEQFVNVRVLFGGVGLLLKGKLGKGLNGIFTGVINVFVGFLELLSLFIRIISLTFRLFGNMTAGEILLIIVAFLAPWVVSSLFFYELELLIGFVQALVFSGLTLVFLTMAVASHGGHSS